MRLSRFPKCCGIGNISDLGFNNQPWMYKTYTKKDEDAFEEALKQKFLFAGNLQNKYSQVILVLNDRQNKILGKILLRNNCKLVHTRKNSNTSNNLYTYVRDIETQKPSWL